MKAVYRTARGFAGNEENRPGAKDSRDVAAAVEQLKRYGYSVDDVKLAWIRKEAERVRTNAATDTIPMAPVLLSPGQVTSMAENKRSAALWERERARRQLRQDIMQNDRLVPVRPILLKPEAR